MKDGYDDRRSSGHEAENPGRGSSQRVQRLTGFAAVIALASLALWAAIIGGLVAIWH